MEHSPTGVFTDAATQLVVNRDLGETPSFRVVRGQDLAAPGVGGQAAGLLALGGDGGGQAVGLGGLLHGVGGQGLGHRDGLTVKVGEQRLSAHN